MLGFWIPARKGSGRRCAPVPLIGDFFERETEKKTPFLDYFFLYITKSKLSQLLQPLQPNPNTWFDLNSELSPPPPCRGLRLFLNADYAGQHPQSEGGGAEIPSQLQTIGVFPSTSALLFLFPLSCRKKCLDYYSRCCSACPVEEGKSEAEIGRREAREEEGGGGGGKSVAFGCRPLVCSRFSAARALLTSLF